MEQALPLDDVEFDMNVEATGDVTNMTAESYLSWVRYQANQLPLVSRANIDTSMYSGNQTAYMPRLEQIPRSKDDVLPAHDWIDSLLKSFSDLRLVIASLKQFENFRTIPVPALKDGISWIQFCLGPRKDNSDDYETSSYMRKRKLACAQLVDIELPVSSDVESDGEESTQLIAFNYADKEPHKPTMSLILQFDQVLVQRLLGYLIKYLQKRCVCMLLIVFCSFD